MADDLNAPAAPDSEFEWDFFLAHAGPDLQIAKKLKQRLEPPAKAFLDDDNLLPGDSFDVVLPAAQRSSLISVVIVSPNSENAYYEREEIAAAIQMAREDPHTHRVVPLVIDAKKLSSRQIPYGLTLKHRIDVPENGEMSGPSQRLLKTLAVMKKYHAKKDIEITNQTTAISKIVDGGNAEVLEGLKEVTKFVRPLLKTLLGLFVLVVLLLIVSLMLPGLLREERVLAAEVLGGVGAVLLASMLGLVALSLTHAQRIAEGGINGG